MATLENFRPGPALDFSVFERNRKAEFDREKLAIEQAIADRKISVEEGKLALQGLEIEVKAKQTQQVGGLADQLGNIFPGGGGPTVQGAPQVPGGLDAQAGQPVAGQNIGAIDAAVQAELQGGAPVDGIVPGGPQIAAPATAQPRRPERIFTPDNLKTMTSTLIGMERVKAGVSKGFREALEFGSDQAIILLKREMAKQQRRAVQLKDEPFDKQKRLLAHFLRQDQNEDIDVSAIEEMLQMDRETLSLEISSDLFLGEQGKKLIDLAIKPAKPPETRERKVGDEIITEELDPATGRFKEISRAPRFQERVPPVTPAGVHTLPDGSKITNAQLLSQYKLENNLEDELGIKILEATNPERAAREREKIDNAVPFVEWARANRGIDILGGFGDQEQEEIRTTDTAPIAVPSRKEQLIIGQRYNTVRGLAVWNGRMFESLGGQ